MTSVFQVLAADTSEQQNALRVATRIAHKRATETFGDFIKGGNRAERLELVANELADLVTATCNEYDIVDTHVLAGIRNSLLGSEPDNLEARTASVHESRKPKLCPYHKEVTDISLAQGEPRAGFDAMAQHAWSSNHCQGSEYEGKCNFKPAMTTQTYWDDKAEKAQERREQREQERIQIEQDLGDLEVPLEETLEADPSVDETELTDNVIEVDFSQNADVVDEGVEADVSLDAVAASVDDSSPLAGKTADLDAALQGDRSTWDDSPGNVIAAYPDGTIILDDGITTFNPQRALDFVAKGGKLQADPKTDSNSTMSGDPNIDQPASPFPLSSNKVAEALETVDVEGTEGPVPEIDKRTWTPTNVEHIDTEGEGSPHPTRVKDVLDAVDYSNEDISSETDAVLEKQDVGKDSNPSNKGDHTKTFPSGGQANPVSSAIDVERNPIREILLEDDGFLPQTEVATAISATR